MWGGPHKPKPLRATLQTSTLGTHAKTPLFEIWIKTAGTSLNRLDTATTNSSSFDVTRIYPDGFEFSPSVFHPSDDAVEEIVALLSASDKLKVLGQTVWCQGVNAIYDLKDGRIVKTGGSVSVDEARAMVFVRTYTSIPVPEVHMVFQRDGRTHIVMERVDGVALREAVSIGPDGLPSSEGLVKEEQMIEIMKQLKEIVRELQELGRRSPPENGWFGAWPSGPFTNSYFGGLIDKPAEPFKSVDEFHAYFLVCLDELEIESIRLTYDDLVKVRSEAQEHAPVLCHGDLAPQNLLVKNGRIVAVVDWETFGWYPNFWEEVALRDKMAGERTFYAIEEVFGTPSYASDTYYYVFACISSPFLPRKRK